ncbi:S9 family peptidase [Massilia sp. IC2-477]|uniref:alpha/beta hydrolase family protein n=1 Tax=Massilia sp. IC2-477 TaxID=2887198 RepID=UPI001D1164C1|nr:S9 family peptidase [Massilia sp. IC2-477]MCC2958814.1 S9 family peptidase [Massilia sp. IC2-477]
MKRLIACLLMLFLSSSAVSDETGKLTIDELVDPSGMKAATLSPDGKHIAAIIYNGTNYGLVLIDTSTFASKKLSEGRYATAGFYQYHRAPRGVRWSGSDLLIVDYGLEVESMDLSGKRVASLGERTIGVLDSGPNAGHVLVRDEGLFSDLALCDPRKGKSKCKRFDQPSGKAIKWAFDSKGELRAATLVNSKLFRDASTISNWYKPSGGEWTRLAEFKVTDDFWLPVYVPDEPHTLVIASRIGRNTTALFNYDVVERRQGEMLVGHPSQDILSTQGIDQEAMHYVATAGMRPQQIWFSRPWIQMQRQVDAVLPNRINVLTGDPEKFVLIRSYADVDPGTWYLFDLPNKKMNMIGKVNQSLDPAKLRPVEITSYQAPDGLTIPAYLTRPHERKEPAPMVVLIHGGPIARDEWEFNAEVQLLAERGYLVFQPQFRGSAGFGREFERAGYREWGRAMQDDITAGVEHLVKRGLADGQRICIVGASYGGYAALWGLVKTPDLYRCGASFAGVSDISRMYSDWSDTSFDKVSRQLMMDRIGDKEKSAELFDPVSPLVHAAKIKAPVLLMHGEEDERVPISHGKKMRDALAANKKDVTWKSFEREGHGLHYIASQVGYFDALLEFLDKHLAAAPARAAERDK